jgi:antitoxin YobK
MRKETIEELIKQADDSFFIGKANEARINVIEQLLSVPLPESYKWFLAELGHGGISGVEILGNGLAEIPACVRSTYTWRKYGLPVFLVVIEDEGTDWIYCLDTSKMENGECPVVDWEQNRGIGQERYETFIDFFIARIKESLPRQ